MDSTILYGACSYPVKRPAPQSAAAAARLGEIPHRSQIGISSRLKALAGNSELLKHPFVPVAGMRPDTQDHSITQLDRVINLFIPVVDLQGFVICQGSE
jgi:hypothetical protein